MRRRRRRKKTLEERLDEIKSDREYYERRISKRPLKSPCLEGRLRHCFRSGKTRSLTPELKCWWCRKTVAQVRAEQRKEKGAGR